MKTAKVFFEDSKYNYSTSINGTDDEIKKYFVGKFFNLAAEGDNMQKCIGVEISDKIYFIDTDRQPKENELKVFCWYVEYRNNRTNTRVKSDGGPYRVKANCEKTINGVLGDLKKLGMQIIQSRIKAYNAPKTQQTCEDVKAMFNKPE